MKTIPKPFKKVPDLELLKTSFPPLKALFFDMDGTLFNTEGIHTDALLAIALKYQIRPPHSPEVVHSLLIGKADHLLFDIIKGWEGVPENWNVDDFIKEKNSNIIQLLLKTPLESYFQIEIKHLLDSARDNGLFIGLVTSSEKLVTTELLKITGLSHVFDLILTRDDCPKYKPDPWPYLKASELSGFEKHEILIFEDSHVGLEAASHTGSHVIKAEWY